MLIADIVGSAAHGESHDPEVENRRVEAGEELLSDDEALRQRPGLAKSLTKLLLRVLSDVVALEVGRIVRARAGT